MNQITFSELQLWEKSGKKYFLIDVRNPEEHHSRNIGGALIPLSEIARSIHKIPTDMPVVIYCRKGVRSRIAIQRLSLLMPTGNLYNLENGIGD